jgi:hypothetical protein
LLDEAADAKRPVDRSFLCGYLRGTKKEDEIVLKSTQRKKRGEAQAGKSGENDSNPFMTSFHWHSQLKPKEKQNSTFVVVALAAVA